MKFKIEGVYSTKFEIIIEADSQEEAEEELICNEMNFDLNECEDTYDANLEVISIQTIKESGDKK